MTLPPDLELRAAAPGDESAIGAMIGVCDETYRSWAPAGWAPPPPGRELERWRGRLTDGSCWTRIAVEPEGRVVGITCFAQAMTWIEAEDRAGEPIPQRAHVSAVFTHPDRWREGIAERAEVDAQGATAHSCLRYATSASPRSAFHCSRPSRRQPDAS